MEFSKVKIFTFMQSENSDAVLDAFGKTGPGQFLLSVHTNSHAKQKKKVRAV